MVSVVPSPADHRRDREPKVATLLDKWKLLGALLADEKVTEGMWRTAFALLDHHNTKTGRCDPSYAALAERARLDERTVKRAVNQLVTAGWFAKIVGGGGKGGRGRRNAYVPALKRVVPGSPFIDAERVAHQVEKGGPPVPKRVVPGPPEHLKEHMNEPSTTTAAKLISIVKSFHISEENAQALIDGALQELDASELKGVVSRAKAQNLDRDDLQAAIGEVVTKWRAARIAGSAAKAKAQREDAEQRRREGEEARKQAEHERQFAEDPAYRVQTKRFSLIKESSSSIANWLQWLPGAVKAAGETQVDRWHADAQEHAPENPLLYLQGRLQEWHEAHQALPGDGVQDDVHLRPTGKQNRPPMRRT